MSRPKFVVSDEGGRLVGRISTDSRVSDGLLSQRMARREVMIWVEQKLLTSEEGMHIQNQIMSSSLPVSVDDSGLDAYLVVVFCPDNYFDDSLVGLFASLIQSNSPGNPSLN